jgi:hypothetical protein
MGRLENKVCLITQCIQGLGTCVTYGCLCVLGLRTLRRRVRLAHGNGYSAEKNVPFKRA